MFVYSETTERREGVSDTYFQSKHVTDTKLSVWVDENKVSVTGSVLLTGHPNSHTLDKRWWRWQTISSMGFRRNKADNIIIYNCSRPADGRVHTPYTHNNMHKTMDFLVDGTGPVADAFRNAMWETFYIGGQEDFYPMMREYGLHSHRLVPTNLRRAFKQNNFDDYTEMVFGKKRKPKLRTAVAQTEPYVVALAHQFRGLVPDKELQGFVEGSHFDDELYDHFVPHTPVVRQYLLRLSESARRQLLTDGLDFYTTQRINLLSRWYNQRSMATILPQMRNTDAGTWEELLTDVAGPHYNKPEHLATVGARW